MAARGRSWGGGGSGDGGSGGGTTFAYNATLQLPTTTINGTLWALAPIDPATGDLKLNIIPRTATWATLKGIAGGVGELASATDQYGVVKYTGAANGAQLIAPTHIVDVSTLTTNSYTVPDGVGRVVVGWFAAQVNAAIGNLSIVRSSTSKPGTLLDVLYIPRSASDEFGVDVVGLATIGGSNVGQSIAGNHAVLINDQVGAEFVLLQDMQSVDVSGQMMATNFSGGGGSTSAVLMATVALGYTAYAKHSFASAIGCNAVTRSACDVALGLGTTGIEIHHAGLTWTFAGSNQTARLTPDGLPFNAATNEGMPIDLSGFGSSAGRATVTILVLSGDRAKMLRAVRKFDFFGTAITNIITPTGEADTATAGLTATYAISFDAGAQKGLNVTVGTNVPATVSAVVEYTYLVG